MYICQYFYMYIYACIYIYIYIYKGVRGLGAPEGTREPWRKGGPGGTGGHFFAFGGLFIDITRFLDFQCFPQYL